MSVVEQILALIVTLGILVSIHEYGHFWVARKCGVKVLRFSIGFGSPLVRWRDRHGTEFVIAALPLGGYVKMLDEREAPVEPAELAYSFNRQSVYKRIAIAAAGPLANFLFAIAAYWIMFGVGTQTLVPVLGPIPENSPAARAGIQSGLEIVEVDGVETPGWSEVNLQLLKRLGDTGAIEFDLKEPNSADTPVSHRIVIDRWLTGEVEPDPMLALGFVPYRPSGPALINEVVPGGAAEQGGMQADDLVLYINDQHVADSGDFVERIQNSPGLLLEVIVEREGRQNTLLVTPEPTFNENETIGIIGVKLQPVSYPQELIRTIEYGWFGSIAKAVDKTWEMTLVILNAIKKMIVGQISVENLGGPITIANAAGTSASYGLESFLNFLAYLSVSLGVLNLLPIPILDGGHLLYYFIELVRGKPLSEDKQALGLKIGMAIIACVMIFAFYNDLSRI